MNLPQWDQRTVQMTPAATEDSVQAKMLPPVHAVRQWYNYARRRTPWPVGALPAAVVDMPEADHSLLSPGRWAANAITGMPFCLLIFPLPYTRGQPGRLASAVWVDPLDWLLYTASCQYKTKSNTHTHNTHTHIHTHNTHPHHTHPLFCFSLTRLVRTASQGVMSVSVKASNH